jgi:hypothetical protein
LVTIDSAGFSFNGRWVRTGLLARHGVEVIVFDRDIKGITEQHRRLTAHLPYWQSELERQPYGYRVWHQGKPLKPNMSVGQRRRQRSRSSNLLSNEPAAPPGKNRD